MLLQAPEFRSADRPAASKKRGKTVAILALRFTRLVKKPSGLALRRGEKEEQPVVCSTFSLSKARAG